MDSCDVGKSIGLYVFKYFQISEYKWLHLLWSRFFMSQLSIFTKIHNSMHAAIHTIL